MADAALVLDGSTLKLSGPITLNTAGPLTVQGRSLLAGLPLEATLDLSQVTRVDSAGVAMLVEFWRLREVAGARLEFVSIPAELQPLLQLYDLEAVFGTGSSG
ncbi:STAS domain-containing protein [Thioalkalivibrio sp.]|uniref:STAS domain-containing protein n=1 Tax=Thioalkalivibrio sp. TaxID=2093813 RepID=UPI0025E40F1E|nr:STAS domain-containing protein [Thioalkalivibrio sp.]